MTSLIALILVLAASIYGAVVLTGHIWILAIPVAIAALPLVIPGRWVRVVVAILLFIWTMSTMGAWTFYIPGLIFALLATRRKQDPSVSPLQKHRGV
ncbi:MAG: hypothetical protein ACT4P5_06685 [Armatimonadota bacterium]